jgi:hypothetical protein
MVKLLTASEKFENFLRKGVVCANRQIGQDELGLCWNVRSGPAVTEAAPTPKAEVPGVAFHHPGFSLLYSMSIY